MLYRAMLRLFPLLALAMPLAWAWPALAQEASVPANAAGEVRSAATVGGAPAPHGEPAGTATAPPQPPAPPELTQFLGDPQQWGSSEGLSGSLQVLLLLTVLSLAPAVILMTTSFVRIVVVLGMLRHALGTQQTPPTQVITSLALFMTLFVMTPVWSDVYQHAVVPYTQGTQRIGYQEAWQRGVTPVKRFMARQIEMAGNAQDVWLFYRYMPPETPLPETYDDVPVQVMLPAFLLSELKVAFLIGFQVYLPFLILDMVIASVTVSMGMTMLPPATVSLPFKLLLFVLVDGWNLVVGMLLESFAPYA